MARDQIFLWIRSINHPLLPPKHNLISKHLNKKTMPAIGGQKCRCPIWSWHFKMKISFLSCFHFSQGECQHIPAGTAFLLSNDFQLGRKLIFPSGQLQGQSQRKQNTSETLGKKYHVSHLVPVPFYCASHFYPFHKRNMQRAAGVLEEDVQTVAERPMSNWPLFF